MWFGLFGKRDSAAHRIMPVLDLVAETVAEPLAPASDGTEPDPGSRLPEVHDSRAHAERLLHWLQHDAPVHDVVREPVDMLHADIIGAYTDMISDIHWERQPWQSVAKHLRVMLGGHKSYAWVLVDGERHRLRVFQIPPPPLPEPVSSGQGVDSLVVARAKRIKLKASAGSGRAKLRARRAA